MILRILHGRPSATRALIAEAAADPRVRERLVRAAGRVDGLETLVVGERRDHVPAPGAVVVLAWRDAERMLAASGRDEPAFLRDRLGLDLDIEHGETYEVMSRTFAALPTPSSVLRIVTMGVRKDSHSSLFERIRVIQQRLAEEGLIASHVARRIVQPSFEVLIVGVWRDAAAVEAATGGRADRMADHGELEPWVDSLQIDAYEAFEIAPRLPMSGGPPIIVLDEERRVVDLTTAAAAVLGRTQDEAVGMQIEDMAAPGDPVGSEAFVRRLMLTDASGTSSWVVPEGGHVMIRWRLARDRPVPGRHTLLVHRLHEPEPTAEDLERAIAEAFRVDG